MSYVGVIVKFEISKISENLNKLKKGTIRKLKLVEI